MLHSEAVVYSKEWRMRSSVQPSVGTDGDRDRRCPVDGEGIRVSVEQSGER
jgi:hypothetical protein